MNGIYNYISPPMLVAFAVVVVVICLLIIKKQIRIVQFENYKKRREKFLHESRFIQDVMDIQRIYPNVNSTPQIIEYTSLDSVAKLRSFNMTKYVTEMLLYDRDKYEDIVQKAAAYNNEYPSFIRRIRLIPRTTAEEAAALGIKEEECHEFEQYWFSDKCPDSLDNFVLCYAEYTSPAGRNHYESEFSMSFDAFCTIYGSFTPRHFSADQVTPVDPSFATRGKVYDNKFISSQKFLANYESNREFDRPGVYIILIYSETPTSATVNNYDDVYVGQSLTVYHRVRQHFTGHGNGDVYADLKYGKKLYVRLIFCDERDMNYYEKKFIAKYNATESYNNTKGGGAYR